MLKAIAHREHDNKRSDDRATSAPDGRTSVEDRASVVAAGLWVGSLDGIDKELGDLSSGWVERLHDFVLHS